MTRNKSLQQFVLPAPGRRPDATAPRHCAVSSPTPAADHDGRFATLPDVVEHYETQFALGLTPQEEADLVEVLKSP
jgi:hypothetical protein